MVWQEGVQMIAMLVSVTEEGQRRCEQYWPDVGTLEYGPFIVTLSGEHVYPDYTIRTLQVEVRQVCIRIIR